jgi:hypothetical protein
VVFKCEDLVDFLAALHLIFAKYLQDVFHFCEAIVKQRKFLNSQQKVNWIDGTELLMMETTV